MAHKGNSNLTDPVPARCAQLLRRARLSSADSGNRYQRYRHLIDSGCLWGSREMSQCGLGDQNAGSQRNHSIALDDLTHSAALMKIIF